MAAQKSRVSEKNRPLIHFIFGFALYALAVVAAFALTRALIEGETVYRTYISAVPGATLCGIFVLLYRFFGDKDARVQAVTTQALAISGVAGLCAHVVSITRSTIGGYEEFTGGAVLLTMASVFLVASIILKLKHL